MSSIVPKKLNLLSAFYFQSVNKIDKLILSGEPPTKEVNIVEHYTRSTKTLGEYVTLDWEHHKDINKIIRAIKQYSLDRTRKRPLNIIMLAEPGSGKSHLVKCIAKKMIDHGDGVGVVSYNMATMGTLDNLAQPLEAVRNLKISDRLPILFLDEFDSAVTNYPILLPLLWDGELHIANQDLKLGKVVIILAGSSFGIPQIIENIRKMKDVNTLEEREDKLVDLLSRINGGLLKIPNLDLKEKLRNRKADKVCLTISLLQSRFGKELECVPWSLLNFIGNSDFRYGVRSITQLIDSIPYDKNIEKQLLPSQLKLPLDSVPELIASSMAYHIKSLHGADEIVDRWKGLALVETLVRFKPVMIEEKMA